MNRRKLYYYHRKFAVVRASYLLIPAVIFAVLAVHGLRTNYSTMVELRQAVYTADTQNGDVETALNNLRRHVYAHMNTNLSSGDAIKPPIQLKARYERLAAQDIERIKAANVAVNAAAEQTCSAQFPAAGFNAPRVACIQDYVGANAMPESASVPEELYKFDFVSPRWSADLAGISIVVSLVFFALFAARWLLEFIMRKRLDI